MKKSLLSIISVSTFGFTALCQNPLNNSFENWTQETCGTTTYHTPNSWGFDLFSLTCLEIPPLDPILIKFIERSSDASSGSYALKLFNGKDDGNKVQSSLLTNIIVENDMPTTHPVSGIPLTVSFYYKGDIIGKDSAQIMFGFYKGDSINLDNQEFEAMAIANLGSADTKSAYTKVTLPVMVTGSQTPDHLYISIDTHANEDEANVPQLGTYLLIDNFESSTTLSTSDQLSGNNIWFNNPVDNQLTFSEAVDEVVVYNSNGAELLKADHVTNLSLHDLGTGLYMIKYNSKGQSRTGKISKK